MNINIKQVKIVVTIPKESVSKVRDAMCSCGAGIIGSYTFCSTTTNVVGTFIPSDHANPTIGNKNQLNHVEEEKLEVVCDIDKAKDVIKELRKYHPYEEPAIDIIPLIDESDL